MTYEDSRKYKEVLTGDKIIPDPENSVFKREMETTKLAENMDILAKSRKICQSYSPW